MFTFAFGLHNSFTPGQKLLVSSHSAEKTEKSERGIFEIQDWVALVYRRPTVHKLKMEQP